MLLDRNTATIFTKYDVYLNPNEDYTFLFWADEKELGDAGAPYIEDLTAVNYVENTVAYTGKAEKKGTGDKKPYTVNCELKHIVTKVTLKTTTDLVAGSEIKVKVPKTYATYNVKEETFTNQTANGYERTVTLTDDITADATNGTEVCSFYALADDNNQAVRITNGNNKGVFTDVTGVPIGPNKHITLRGDVENAGLTGVTFTATVDEQWGSTIPDLPFEKLDLTKGAINITENGTYHITSNGTTTTNAITVSGNISPKIYISDLNMAVSSGNAISITGGANATIFVMGENAIETSKSISYRAAGIYVAQGSSVTIEGNGTDDVLRVTGGTDGAAIGGYCLNSHPLKYSLQLNNQ